MRADQALQFVPLVQALGEGKTIQFLDSSNQWGDLLGTVDFTHDVTRYRIKPKPREFWVNIYPDGRTLSIYSSEGIADRFALPDRTECIQVREVL